VQYSAVARTIVVDTDVFISALLGKGASNRFVDTCLAGEFDPLMGPALFAEYQDVMGRDEIFERSLLSPRERDAVLDVFLSVCRWVRIYYAWRPNLLDEGDNHLIELAVAGGATAIVTKNKRDLSRGELRFPGVMILTPEEVLGEPS
jgi:putative PIN family toxin of toxin-antitoxin system